MSIKSWTLLFLIQASLGASFSFICSKRTWQTASKNHLTLTLTSTVSPSCPRVTIGKGILWGCATGDSLSWGCSVRVDGEGDTTVPSALSVTAGCCCKRLWHLLPAWSTQSFNESESRDRLKRKEKNIFLLAVKIPYKLIRLQEKDPVTLLNLITPS